MAKKRKSNPSPKARVTRVEVARRAGVSKTTVTNVLAGGAAVPIHPDTRARVLDAARELGYQPNFAARSLVQRSTNIIGLLLPSKEAQFGVYYSRMIAGLLAATEETPYNFLYLSQEHPHKYAQCLAQGYLDAAIILQSHVDDTHAAAVARTGLPAVTMNYVSQSNLPLVSVDYEGVIDLTYGRLIDAGARAISFVCEVGGLQPNMRHLKRHQALSQKLKERARFSHESTVTDLLAALDRGAQIDSFVVDGLPNGMAAYHGLRSRGMTPGADTRLIVLNTGETTQDVPAGMVIYEAQPEKVGIETWKVIERLFQGKEVPKSTLVPFMPRDTGAADTQGR